MAGSLSLWGGFANNFVNLPLLALGWPLSVTICSFNASTRVQAFFSGWLISFIGGSCALYWLAYPVSQVGGLPWLLAFLCAFFIAAILALQGAFFSVTVHAFFRYISPIAILAIPLLWYIYELAFAWGTGFPWLSLSGSFGLYPLLLQHASITGAWLGAVLWLMPFLAVYFFVKSRKKIYLLMAAVLIFFFPLYGVLSLSGEKNNGQEIHAIFIEGNIDQNQKWLPSFQKFTFDIYTDLSIQAVKKSCATGIQKPLLIWPETAMPFFLEKSPGFRNELSSFVKSLDVPLLFGAPGLSSDKEKKDGHVFNRAFFMKPDGKISGYYDKMHLVPFGEYLPEWLDISFLSSLLQGVGIYESGSNPYPLQYDDLALGILICYEGIFPWLADQRVQNGANILVDISNDGWFGFSPAARQHLYLTVPRAIEQNRWLLRATNTGISAAIDNKGRIAVQGEMFKRGAIAAYAYLQDTRTIYSKISQFIPIIVLTILFLLYILEIMLAGFRKTNVTFK